MNEKWMQFLAKVSEDKELSEKIGKETDVHAIIAAAKELGFELTEADFDSEELSDDELDTITGGTSVNCSCAFGGGGTKDENDKTCACVLAGLGYTKDGTERCFCPVAGIGYDY